MPNLNVNGIDIAYETYGDVGGATIVMIQGLGMPLIAWPPPIIERLTEAGYHVVAMDNRDIGLSETFHDAGVPNLAWQWFRHRIGLKPRVLYGLKDMAQDVASLMARLDIHNAHVVGVSMGGMIGQRLAIDHGGRVSSLVSIMSTTGNPRLPRPEPEVLKKLLQRPRTDDIEDRLAH
ncbi:MAG: alpha/beta hydrolase, partial [Pseudomonadota bacterium]